MKKLLVFLLSVCLLLSFTACGQPADDMYSYEEVVVGTSVVGGGDTQSTASTDADVIKTTNGEKGENTSVKTDENGKTEQTENNLTTSEQRTRTRRTTTVKTTTTKKTTTYPTKRTTVKRTYPTDKKIVVSCIGDSITAGQYYAALTQGAPADMAGALSSRYEVRGYGRSGATAMENGLDNGNPLGYSTTTQYYDSLRLQADIVVIMLGTNDAKYYNWEMSGNANGKHFKESLINLVAAYQNLDSKPTVILATPPKIFRGDIEWVPSYIPEKINPIIRQVADTTGCLVADVYAATESASRVPDFNDGIHPSSTKGRSLIAHTIAEVIKRETGVA